MLALLRQRLPQDLREKVLVVFSGRLYTRRLYETVVGPGYHVQEVARTLFNVDAKELLGNVQAEPSFEENLFIVLRELCA